MRDLATLGYNQRDVIVLLLGTEVENLVDDIGERRLRRGCSVAKERVHKARFAELVSSGVEGFGDAIGVERQDIARCKLTFAKLAVPFFENAKDGGGCV